MYCAHVCVCRGLGYVILYSVHIYTPYSFSSLSPWKLSHAYLSGELLFILQNPAGIICWVLAVLTASSLGGRWLVSVSEWECLGVFGGWHPNHTAVRTTC